MSASEIKGLLTLPESNALAEFLKDMAERKEIMEVWTIMDNKDCGVLLNGDSANEIVNLDGIAVARDVDMGYTVLCKHDLKVRHFESNEEPNREEMIKYLESCDLDWVAEQYRDGCSMHIPTDEEEEEARLERENEADEALEENDNSRELWDSIEPYNF